MPRLLMLALATLVALPAIAAPPPLAPRSEEGVTIDVPQDWKLHVKPHHSNVTVSAGITTNITLYWYPYTPGITLDEMLDILVKTVNDTLPVGAAEEIRREPIPALPTSWEVRRGMRMHAEVDALGYTMKLGLVATIDERTERIVAAFLIAPPDTYADLEGLDLLTDVVTSLRLDDDPPAPPPGWWWQATPPATLARAQ